MKIDLIKFEELTLNYFESKETIKLFIIDFKSIYIKDYHLIQMPYCIYGEIYPKIELIIRSNLLKLINFSNSFDVNTYNFSKKKNKLYKLLYKNNYLDTYLDFLEKELLKKS